MWSFIGSQMWFNVVILVLSDVLLYSWFHSLPLRRQTIGEILSPRTWQLMSGLTAAHDNSFRWFSISEMSYYKSGYRNLGWPEGKDVTPVPGNLSNSLYRGCISQSVTHSLSLQDWVLSREVRKVSKWFEPRYGGKISDTERDVRREDSGTLLILTLDEIEAIVAVTLHSSRSWNMYNCKWGLLLAFRSFKPALPSLSLWHSLCFRKFFFLYTKYQLLSDC